MIPINVVKNSFEDPSSSCVLSLNNNKENKNNSEVKEQKDFGICSIIVFLKVSSKKFK